MDKDRVKQLEQERGELAAMLNKGVSFEVKDVELTTTKRMFGLIRKHEQKEVTRHFVIEELTLATLDRLSAEWIEIAIDEEKLKTNNGMTAAHTLSQAHAIRCARIIAIAVLGEKRLIPKYSRGRTDWVEDKAEIDRLTELFARKIKPSKLYQLFVLVNAMCNIGDFLNSIRLMQTERTTAPIRIEENITG